MIVALVLSSANIGSFAQGAATVTEYAITTKQSPRDGITDGPTGAMRLAAGHGNMIGRIAMDGKITEFAIPTAESNPGVLTSGPDGAIWFLERDGNKIGRITMDGKITEFAIPTGGSEVQTASGRTVTTSTPQGIVS